MYDAILQRSEQLRVSNMYDPDPRFTQMLNEFQNAVLAKQAQNLGVASPRGLVSPRGFEQRRMSQPAPLTVPQLPQLPAW